jgi:alpha-glucoside transport system permease protein
MTSLLAKHASPAARLHALLGRVPVVTLWLVVVLWSVPTVGLLVNSFRAPMDQRNTGWWEILFNPQVTLDAYAGALAGRSTGTLSVGEAFLNSFAIAVPSTLIPLVIAAMAAYAFAWMRFPGRHVLFILVVGMLVIPIQATLVPLLLALRGSGWLGTFPCVWLIHTVLGMPFAIFLLHNSMAQLPSETIDAARVDGAGDVVLFRKFILPLSVPALAAFGTLQFLGCWNDYLVALVFIQTAEPANVPLTVVLVNLVTAHGDGLGYLPAAAFISMVVPLVVYFALQRYFVKGLVTGAVK